MTELLARICELILILVISGVSVWLMVKRQPMPDWVFQGLVLLTLSYVLT